MAGKERITGEKKAENLRANADLLASIDEFQKRYKKMSDRFLSIEGGKSPQYITDLRNGIQEYNEEFLTELKKKYPDFFTSNTTTMNQDKLFELLDFLRWKMTEDTNRHKELSESHLILLRKIERFDLILPEKSIKKGVD